MEGESGYKRDEEMKSPPLPLFLHRAPLFPTNDDSDLDEHTRSCRVRFRSLSTSLKSTEDGVSRVDAGVACKKRTS
jgi:hypothetical protein